MKRAGLMLLAVGFAGCAHPKEPTKPVSNLSTIRKVAVLPFQGEGGQAVANEFVRQLVAAGLQVWAVNKNVDAVIGGSVVEYKPAQKLTVYLGQAQIPGAAGEKVTVTNPITSLSGSAMSAEGVALALPATQMVASVASAGVVARLTDSSSGNVIWAGEFTYEAVDVQTALTTVITSLAQSLSNVLPAAKQTAAVH